MLIKKFIKRIFNIFGLELRRLTKEDDFNIDSLLVKKINKNPIIFDVGSNKGQSIEKYIKIFKEPIIHAFEPVETDYKLISEKFKNYKNIFLNNYALGDKIDTKPFNITIKSANSSFNKVNVNSKWLINKATKFNISVKDYTTEIKEVRIDTLDNYCKNNNIKTIDLLKIDTQGYEDKVLKGGINFLQKNSIKIVLTELMFDNAYDRYLSFSDVEKFLLPNNFRMVAIELDNDILFKRPTFSGDICYLNKNFYNLNEP